MTIQSWVVVYAVVGVSVLPRTPVQQKNSIYENFPS